MIDVIEQFRLIRGTALEIPVTLRDSQGATITQYDGGEALTCRVWPGAGLPTVCEPAVGWEDPLEGVIVITIEAADTAGLTAGRYRLLVTLDDGGRTVAAFEAVLILVPGPVA